MWNFSQISNSVSRNRKNSYLLNGVILEQPIKKWVNQQEQKKMMMKTERDGVFLKKKKIHGKKCEKIPCPSMKITFTKNHLKVLYIVVSRKKRKKTLNFNAELQTAISCLPCKRKKTQHDGLTSDQRAILFRDENHNKKDWPVENSS